MRDYPNKFRNNLLKLLSLSSLLSILFLMLFFAGCSLSSQSGDYTKIQNEDNSGNGLEVNFDIDDSRSTFKILRYDLTFYNSGKENVKLSKDNIKIIASPIRSDGGNQFTSESINTLYSNIFQSSSELILVQNQPELTIGGILEINDDYFKNDLKQDDNFDINLNINYDYKTSFSNNLKLELDQKNVLKSINSLSQAAPIQISKIEIHQIGIDSYEIGFWIQDYGKRPNTGNAVNLENFQFTFSKDENLQNCNYWEKESGSLINKGPISSGVKMQSRTEKILISCPIDLSNFDKNAPFTTSIRGSFDYNYKFTIKKKVSLPKDKSLTASWDKNN